MSEYYAYQVAAWAYALALTDGNPARVAKRRAEAREALFAWLDRAAELRRESA